MLGFGYYNMDCMQGMKEFPDKYFDLAIVDPPYGDGGVNGQELNGSGKGSTVTGVPRGGGTAKTSTTCKHWQGANSKAPDGTWKLPKWRMQNESEGQHKKIIAWDVAPGQEYFNELFRISRNQIIWGGNYFELPKTRCFLIWRKTNVPQDFSMAMCEYAWTSFNDNAKVFEYTPQGRPSDNRFHPTQKPVALYEWILNRYAKEGDKILDTHVGSGSSLIACRNTNHKYVGFEIDADYYRLAKERIDRESAQMNIFDFM